MFCFLDVGDETLPRALSVINCAHMIHYAREWTKIERNGSPGYHILKTKHRSQYGDISVLLKWFQKRLKHTYGLQGKPGTS